MIPSLVSLVEEALAAGEVLLRCGRAVPRSEAEGVRGAGERDGENRHGAGSAGEEVFLFESVSTNPFPRLTLPLNICFWDLRPVTILPDQTWKCIFSFSRFFVLRVSNSYSFACAKTLYPKMCTRIPSSYALGSLMLFCCSGPPR